MKRRSRPSKALMGRQLKEATERQEAAQSRAAAKYAFEAQRLQPLTWAEAQRIVEFVVDGNRYRRHGIYDPLPIQRIDSSAPHENGTADASAMDLDASATTDKMNSSTVSHRGRPAKNGPRKIIKQSQNSNLQQKQRIPVPEAKYEELEDYVKVAPRKHVRPTTPYFKFSSHQQENAAVEKIEYDLDDQDAFWLKALNERRRSERLPLVNESIFETIIDKLEKAAHFEAQNSGRLNETGVDEDAVCCICLDGDCLNANAILFCDMCNLAVHQECYGVPYIPEGQWLCRRCLESPSMPVACCLCPNKGGAFKRTDDGRWAHVVCALWIPEVSFSNSVFLEPIEGINMIPPARWRLKCYLCKKSGVGAAIQCHRQHCYSAFHVTCAITAGLFMRIDANPSSEDRIKRTAYCDTHTPPNSDAVPMISHGVSDGERSSSNSPNAMGRLMKKRNKIKQARKQLAQHQIVSSQVVINVPTISEASLQQISAQHARLAGKSDLMRQILAYWQLKRKSRCGVPLIRRLHVSSNAPGGMGGSTDYLKENPGMEDGDGSSIGGAPNGLVTFAPNINELANSSDPYIREHVHQLRTFRLLRQNLERVRLLIELVHKRERMKRDIQKVSLTTLDHTLAPFQMVLRSLLGKLRSLDKRDLFELPVSARSAPTYQKVIKKPMCFSKMEERLEEDEYSTIEEFEKDFNLIVDNCMTFNPKTTTFYKAAVELKNAAAPVFTEARQYIISAEFDSDTGMYVSTLQSVPALHPIAAADKSPKNLATRTSPTAAAAERRRSQNNQHHSLNDSNNSEESDESKDQKGSSRANSESPVPRVRRNVNKFSSPTSIEALLPHDVREVMSVEEQLAILHDNLEAAVRTGKAVVAAQLRREISAVKKKNCASSERCSSASTESPSKPDHLKGESKSVKDEPKETSNERITRHRNSMSGTTSPDRTSTVGSPKKAARLGRSQQNGAVKYEREIDSRTNSPMSVTRSPTPAGSNGLLMIASPGKHTHSPRSNSPRIPIVASTPMVQSNGLTKVNSAGKSDGTSGPRISTRRSAAQAGIQLPSVFGMSPPPYKSKRLSGGAIKCEHQNGSPVNGHSKSRQDSPLLHPSLRVGSPSSLHKAIAPYSPTLHRHASMNSGSFDHGHGHGAESTPTSPSSTPGVNRRTAVLFQGKKRPTMPSASPQASGKPPHSTCSSPTRSPSVASLAVARSFDYHHHHGGAASVSPGAGTLTVQNGHHGNGLHHAHVETNGHHHDGSGKLSRRMSSSSTESFRCGSALSYEPPYGAGPSSLSAGSLTEQCGSFSPTSLRTNTVTAISATSIDTDTGSAREGNTTAPNFALSDSDEELLADMKRNSRRNSRETVLEDRNRKPGSRAGSVSGGSLSVPSGNLRSRRSSAASGISNTASYTPRPFDIVWIRGSSPSPISLGLVVDPTAVIETKSNLERFQLLKRMLPTLPTNDLLASSQDKDPSACLVLHFELKHSWRWVPASKLEPFDPAAISLSDLHLPPPVQDLYRRACVISSKLSSAVLSTSPLSISPV